MLMNLKNFWEYVKAFEPARLRSAWIAFVGLVATFGFVVPNDVDQKATAIITFLVIALPIIQGEWTRRNVVPVARYDSDVEAALNTPAPDEALVDAADVEFETSEDFVPDEVQG